MRVITLASILILFSTISYACPARFVPSLLGTGLDDYSSILVGKVHTVYPSGRIMTNVEANVSERMGDQYAIASDVPPSTLLTIEVTEVIRGHSHFVRQLFVGGCGVYPPEVGDVGLFFVTTNEYWAAPIYESWDNYEFWYSKTLEVEASNASGP